MKMKALALLALAVCLATGCSSKEKYFSKAEKSLQEGQYTEALEQYNKAIMEDEKLQLSYRGAGICSLNLKEYEKADDYFLRALQQSKGIIGDVEIDIAYYRAECKRLLGQDEEALKIYTSILDYDSEQSDARLWRGVIYANMDKISEAKKEFAQVIKEQPDQVGLYYQIYQTLKSAGEQDAESYLEQGVACKDDSMEGLYLKGCLCQAAGEIEKALELLQESQKKGYAKSAFRMGLIYEDQGDLTKALECYSQYKKLSNMTAEETIQMLECRMSTGDFATAQSECAQAIENSKGADLQTLQFYEAVIYEKAGDFDGARSKIEQYQELYPEDEKAKKEYIFLLSR